ncbi:MAG: hypothetical protein IPH12_04115 [Saprospirales bacterium]|nr:hypothetical protein [Saprospirales bacterium]
MDIAFAANRLYINNYNGNNVLVYQQIPATPNQWPDFAVGAPDITAQTLDSIHYIQNPVLASDGVRLIATSDFDREINIWNSFPTQSGREPDQRIAVSAAVQVWANALYGNTFVIAGRKTVSVWTDASLLSPVPDRTFNNAIGTAVFTDLGGVALDGQFFYLADKSGKIYGWNGIPASASENPAFTISNPGLQYGFLYSDGQYLCAVQSEPPAAVYVYRVSDLAAGSATPYRTIGSGLQLQLNQPTQAITFGQALAIACRGSHAVYLWKDLTQAGDVSQMVVLGQPSATAHQAAIGISNLFMPASLMAYGNSLWVGEFKFSSRIVKFSYGTTTAPEIPVWEREMSIFPNPVTDNFTLQLLPACNGEYRIDLLDGNGRLLRRLAAPLLYCRASAAHIF